MFKVSSSEFQEFHLEAEIIIFLNKNRVIHIESRQTSQARKLKLSAVFYDKDLILSLIYFLNFKFKFSENIKINYNLKKYFAKKLNLKSLLVKFSEVDY